MQQGVQTDTTYNIQQCCVRLYKAFGLRNPFNNKVVKFQKPGQASLSLKWPHGYTKRALSRPSRLLSCERRSNHGATAIENGKKAIGLGPVCILEVQPPSTINFSQRLYEKKVYPFTRVNSTRTCSDCLRQRLRMLWFSRLDRVDPAGRGKVFYGEKLTWLGGWPYHHKRMNPARCATLLAEPTFCFVCKGFARIVRKWKVGSPRVALAGGWPFCPITCDSTLMKQSLTLTT